MNKHDTTTAAAQSKAGSPSSTMVLAGKGKGVDVTREAIEGYDAAIEAKNPYFTSSSSAMAWALGDWMSLQGMPKPKSVKGSRGYWLRADGVLYRMDGSTVTKEG